MEVTYAAEELPEHPLAVILLALLAAHGHRVAESRDEESILGAVWNWERDKWRRYLRDRGLREEWEAEALGLIEAALVVATLGRPFSRPEEVEAFWEANLSPRAVTADGRRLSARWLAQRLPDLFPAPTEDGAWYLPPIVPDPLADWVMAQRLKGHPELVTWALPTSEEIADAVSRLVETLAELVRAGETEGVGQAATALVGLARPSEVLKRVARLWDAPSGREAARQGLEAAATWVDAAIHGLDGDAARFLLDMLHNTLPAPDRTLALRGFLVELYRRQRDLAADDAERARALGMLGYALSELGRREEALQATQEALDIRRQLANANPQAFLPNLAMSLNNLGRDLSNLGRREEALQATQEAVKHYRQLANANPQAFLPDLAMSLNNLGAMLSALGRRQEALQATQEAVKRYRQLANANPQAFLPNLAASLNNLGRDLSAQGRHEEALQATQEAVDIRRQLANANPQAFLPDLAMSLNNLGAMLSALGRRQEALQATQEAVDIRRQLAHANPQAFLPNLAASLNNLGNVLSALGRREEAAQAFAEGLRAILPFVQALPAAFGRLASALLEEYLSACREAGEEPDGELVEEVRQALAL